LVYLVVGYFDDLDKAGEAIEKLRELGPSSLDMVDAATLNYIQRHLAEDLNGLLPENTPQLVLLIEFDDASQLTQLRKVRRAGRILAKYAEAQRSSDNVLEQEALWRIRQSIGSLWMADGSAALPPAMSDAAVAPGKLVQLLTLVERLGSKHEVELLTWGHAGTGQVWVQPVIDLSKKKARDVLPKLMNDYYEMVLSLGGTVTASHGDGIARAPYLKALYGEEAYELVRKVKEAFDPHGIFNPLTKFAEPEQVAALVRAEYQIRRDLEHLPQ
jgi:FAD/FMN-containing dehydrogenase